MGTKILSLAQIKGGCGKTTIASHIAGTLSNRGHSVVVVDCDNPQYSLTNWYHTGEAKKNIELVKVNDADDILEAVKEHDGKVDFILIDLAPRLKDITRAAVAMSDLTVIPVNVDMVEIWALKHTLDLMVEVEKKIPDFKYFVMTNKYQSHNENQQQMRDSIQNYFNCKLLDSTLGLRKAFPHALGHGVTVHDLNPKTPKAIEEMDGLVDEILTKMEV